MHTISTIHEFPPAIVREVSATFRSRLPFLPGTKETAMAAVAFDAQFRLQIEDLNAAQYAMAKASMAIPKTWRRPTPRNKIPCKGQ
jgi:hypothetical protein